jgi:hypothetical protein
MAATRDEIERIKFNGAERVKQVEFDELCKMALRRLDIEAALASLRAAVAIYDDYHPPTYYSTDSMRTSIKRIRKILDNLK